MVRLSSSQKASIKGGDCSGLVNVMEVSALFGQLEVALVAYCAYLADGCSR